MVPTASGATKMAADTVLRAPQPQTCDFSTVKLTSPRLSLPNSSRINGSHTLELATGNDENGNSADHNDAATETADIDNQDLSPRESSPTDGEKLDSSTDLQFKKKDFRKARAQLFQLVLLSASLKSLKQQSTQGNPPQLLRNHSIVSTNSKNFQLFIQAPVLSSVTNFRQADEVEIGQQLPFDHRSESASMFPDLTKTSDNNDASPQEEDDDDDIYKEETTLQQQRLTINALKKLSLSLAPIIRLEEDDSDLQPRQLTTKLLNGGTVPEQRLKLRPGPYQPAKVDLSSFSSLTRQRGFMDAERGRPEVLTDQSRADVQSQSEGLSRILSETQSQNQSQSHSLSLDHALKPVQSHLLSEQPNSQLLHNRNQGISLEIPTMGVQGFVLDYNGNHATTINSGPNSINNKYSQDRGRFPRLDTRPPQPSGQSISKAVPVNGFKPFGNIEHTIGGRSVSRYPVVPPHDMNIRNRKVSIQHEPQLPPTTRSMSDKKLQQIKEFRSPGYVPAVLRRTTDDDKDVGPVTSNGLDPDSADNGRSLLNTVLPLRETTSPMESIRSYDLVYSNESIQPGLLKTGPYTLSKRQYEHILRAAPTRKHWLKDESVAECGFSTCHKHFNFFERRHHCRKCGGIFCKDHTSHYLYINHLAQFTTGGRGTLSRVCDNCIEEYNEFMKSEFGVGYQSPRSRPSLPNPGSVDFRKEIFKPKSQTIALAQPVLLPISSVERPNKNDQLAGSVPANWSWLSF